MSTSKKAPKATGIDRIHVAPIESDEAGSKAPVFGTPVWIPEATQNQVNPQNFADKFYADNGVSEVFSGTTGAQVQVTIAGAEQDIHAAIQGKTPPSENDVYIIEDLADDPQPVAYGYRRKIYGKTDDGRQKYRYVWLLKVTFTPPNEQSDTQGEKTTVQPGQYSGEAAGLDSFKPDKLLYKVTMDNWRPGVTPEHEENFFKTVQWKQPETPPVELPEEPEPEEPEVP